MRAASLGQSAPASSGGAAPSERSLLGRAVDFLSASVSFPRASERDDAEVPDRRYDLLMTQRADGHFVSSGVLMDWLGADRQTALTDAVARHEESVVVTLVVVRLLEREAQDRQLAWRPALAKARSWLKAHPSDFDAEIVVCAARA